MKDVLEGGSPPIHTLDEKKIKRDHVWDEDLLPFHPAKRKRSPTYDPELLTFGGDPTSGSEFRSIARPTDSQTVNTIIIQTTRELAAVGKRLVRAPQLLDNGIAFDWVRDDDAKQEPVSSLLSITGIDPVALESALQRVTTSSTSEKGGGQAAAAIIIDLLSDHGSDIGDDEPAAQAVNLDGADAAHPIIIDTDEDTGGEQSEQSVANKDGTEASQLPSRSAQIITGIACHPHAERSTHVVNEAGPSQQRPPDTYSGEVEETSAPCRSQYPDRSELETRQGVRALGTQRVGQAASGHYKQLYGAFNSLVSSSDSDSLSGEDNFEEPSGGRTVGSPGAAKDTRSRELGSTSDTRNREQTAVAGDFAGTDRSLRDTRHTGEPVGSSAGSSAAGARRPSRSRRSHTSVGSSSARTWPLQQIGRPSVGRPVSLGDLEERKSDADESNSSEGYGESRRPVPATQRRAAERPALRRSSARTRAGLFGVNAQIDRHEVNVPKAEFARARRLIAPIDRRIPYTTVTMRGDASFIDKQGLFRVSALSLPFYQPDKAPASLVVDACLVEDDKVIVGYERGPHQASLILLGDQPRHINLAHRAHSTVQENLQVGTSRPNPGISTLAPANGSRLRFLSGGYDKTVHLWTLKQTADGVDETVFACGGKSISAANISTLHAPKPVRVSDGRILQVHVHPQDTRVVILETDHLDNQVLVYDTRKGSFNCRPTLQFGHRDEHAPDIVRRFVKGSALNSYFARPYTNSEMSVVRVWDYRKATAVVACFQEEHPAPIVHAVLSGSDLLAYGGHTVTIWKTSSGR